MSGSVVALAGWLAAAVALAIAGWAWRARSSRMEAIARACHELRGPITATRLGLQFEARTTDVSADTLRALDLELGRASLALDDLSGVGLERGSGHGEFDVGALLADAVEASRPSADQRGVTLSLIVGCGGPATHVPGDRLRIAQATRNLIANAIEHGGGPVEVRYRADAATVRIEVLDGGPGLPAPVAELTRRARRGRGLRGRGLAISAAIAADHGGRLASAPSERGARLVLELPARVS